MARLAWDSNDEVLKEVTTVLLKEHISKLRDRQDFRDMVASGRYAELVMRMLEAP